MSTLDTDPHAFDHLVNTVAQGRAWANTAAFFARDVDYWRERALTAEARLSSPESPEPGGDE